MTVEDELKIISLGAKRDWEDAKAVVVEGEDVVASPVNKTDVEDGIVAGSTLHRNGYHQPSNIDDDGKRIGICIVVLLTIAFIFYFILPLVSFICTLLAMILSSVISCGCCCASNYELQPEVKRNSSATLVALAIVFVLQIIYVIAATTALAKDAQVSSDGRQVSFDEDTMIGATVGALVLSCFVLVLNVVAVIHSILFVWGRKGTDEEKHKMKVIGCIFFVVALVIIVPTVVIVSIRSPTDDTNEKNNPQNDNTNEKNNPQQDYLDPIDGVQSLGTVAPGYEFLGKGKCNSLEGRWYDFISTESLSDIESCGTFCDRFYRVDGFRGFEGFGKNRWGDGQPLENCKCLFDTDKDYCDLSYIALTYASGIQTSLNPNSATGVGTIHIPYTDYDYRCFKTISDESGWTGCPSAQPTSKPTTPSTKPNVMDLAHLSYDYVGNGDCQGIGAYNQCYSNICIKSLFGVDNCAIFCNRFLPLGESLKGFEWGGYNECACMFDNGVDVNNASLVYASDVETISRDRRGQCGLNFDIDSTGFRQDHFCYKVSSEPETMAEYRLVGQGYCQDSNNSRHSSICSRLATLSSESFEDVDSCGVRCDRFRPVEDSFRGYLYGPDWFEEGHPWQTNDRCCCLFDAEVDVSTIFSVYGQKGSFIGTASLKPGTGTGSISSTDNTEGVYCYEVNRDERKYV